MADYALRLENGADTAPRMRMGDAVPLGHADPLDTRTGLRPDNGGAVAIVAGSMDVQVSPFLGWLSGGTSVAQGGYPFVLDATKTLTLDAGDASQARTDTIAAVVRDDAFDTSGATEAVVEVVKGTPGAGAPALPATALPLRDVIVPAGASAGTGGLSGSDLGADRREWLAAAGGILRVSGATARDALPAVAGAAVYREDTDRVEVHDGTGWQTYAPLRDSGWQSGNITAASGFAINDARVRKVGELVQVEVYLQLTTTQTYGAGSGAIADVTLANIPVEYAPSGRFYAGGVFGGVNATGYVETDGRVNLEAINGTGSGETFDSTDYAWFTFTYFAG